MWRYGLLLILLCGPANASTINLPRGDSGIYAVTSTFYDPSWPGAIVGGPPIMVLESLQGTATDYRDADVPFWQVSVDLTFYTPDLHAIGTVYGFLSYGTGIYFGTYNVEPFSSNYDYGFHTTFIGAVTEPVDLRIYGATLTPVPLPGAIWLFLGGCLIMGWSKRFR